MIMRGGGRGITGERKRKEERQTNNNKDERSKR